MSQRPVLFLDGPLKGEIWSLETSMYVLRVPVARSLSMSSLLERYDAPDYSPWDTVDYRIQPLMLFGQKLWFASVSYPWPSEDSLSEMMWEMLTSGYAQRLRDGIASRSG